MCNVFSQSPYLLKFPELTPLYNSPSPTSYHDHRQINMWRFHRLYGKKGELCRK